MANILGRYGQGRELAHFKIEQEADIQALRKRLIKEGKLDALALPEPASTSTSTVRDADGDEVSPVLMEVLQASARLSDPTAYRRRIWELRRKAGLPPLSEADLQQAVRKLQGGTPLSMIVPSSMSLSTNSSFRELRQVAAYGTAASLVGVAALGTAAAHYFGITCLNDVKLGVKAWAQSWRDPLREAVAPVKAYMAGWLPKRDVSASLSDDFSRQPSEFSDRMRRRYGR